MRCMAVQYPRPRPSLVGKSSLATGRFAPSFAMMSKCAHGNAKGLLTEDGNRLPNTKPPIAGMRIRKRKSRWPASRCSGAPPSHLRQPSFQLALSQPSFGLCVCPFIQRCRVTYAAPEKAWLASRSFTEILTNRRRRAEPLASFLAARRACVYLHPRYHASPRHRHDDGLGAASAAAAPVKNV